jgi:hypothetical protein
MGRNYFRENKEISPRNKQNLIPKKTVSKKRSVTQNCNQRLWAIVALTGSVSVQRTCDKNGAYFRL